jgi:hypothetical protein
MSGGMSKLSPIRTDGFTLEPIVDSATIAVKLSGNADSHAVLPLELFLKQLHEKVVEDGGTEVHVDLVDLYFMNSSCIKALASWMHKVKITGSAYKVYLEINPRLPWQRRSLEPIRRLTPTVAVLRVDGKDS